MKRSEAYSGIIFVMAIVSQCINTVFMILRVFALYGRSVWVLLLTTFIGCSSLGVTLWLTANNFQLESFFDNLQQLNIWFGTEANVAYAGGPAIAFDVIVFALVAVKGLVLSRAQKLLRRERKSLARIILEDGSLYFLIMAIVNVINFLALLSILTFGGVPIPMAAVGPNTLLTISISTTMISRLVLNLRKEARRSGQGGLTTFELSTFQARAETAHHLAYGEMTQSYESTRCV